jgi:hypothetical protein
MVMHVVVPILVSVPLLTALMLLLPDRPPESTLGYTLWSYQVRKGGADAYTHLLRSASAALPGIIEACNTAHRHYVTVYPQVYVHLVTRYEAAIQGCHDACARVSWASLPHVTQAFLILKSMSSLIVAVAMHIVNSWIVYHLSWRVGWILVLTTAWMVLVCSIGATLVASTW